MIPAPARTKIVATIGPSSNTSRVVQSLIRAGARVLRLNMAHGTHEQRGREIRIIRSVSRTLDTPVCICADLQGPKIRTGPTADDQPVVLKKRSRVVLTARPVACTSSVVSVGYRNLARDVPRGATILLNDGAVRLAVKEINKQDRSLVCTVLNTGVISSRKGVNFPNIPLSVPSLTPKDRRDLRFLLDHDVNAIAQSFVRTAADLKYLRAQVAKSGKAIKIIAKIEKPEALGCLSQILERCDGIMVARGDLGVETSLWEVPVLQKRFVADANSQGKIVIVATQMLESMIEHGSPTRAETTDVANAIIDGTDAVMLSGETAVGSYPVQAVSMMARIAAATERSEFQEKEFVDLRLRERYPPHAICEAAVWASRDLGGVPICVFTQSGDTALYLSKLHHGSPIFAFSPSKDVVNALACAPGVAPSHAPVERDAVSLVRNAEQQLLKNRFVSRGEPVVVISGTTPVKGATNLLRIKRVGDD